MKNTGDLSLTLPLLPDGWTWDIKYQVENFGNPYTGWSENVLVISVHRPADDTWIQDPVIAIERYDDYDSLIAAVQSSVDGLYDAANNFDKKVLTTDDAIEHVLSVFDKAMNTVHTMSPNTARAAAGYSELNEAVLTDYVSTKIRRYNSLRDIGHDPDFTEGR